VERKTSARLGISTDQDSQRPERSSEHAARCFVRIRRFLSGAASSAVTYSSCMGPILNRLAARCTMACLALLTFWLMVPQGVAAPAAQMTLSVVTTPTAPFVLPNTDPMTGFSVDVWNEVARRLHVDFTLRAVPADDRLPSLQRGEADVAIGLIVMTPEDERRVDFSAPYFDSGLQIMVRAQGEGRLLSAVHSIPWASIGELFGVAILVVLALANVLWLVERRYNPRFRKSYLTAIGEGLWGSMLIIATGEYGDRDAPDVIKRIAVVSMWLLGVVLIAQLTATVTSSQTVARLQSEIHGPAHLPGKTITATPGTIAGDYLVQHGLPFVSMPNPDEGIRMLTRGEVQAIVLSAAILQYLATQPGNQKLQVVGPIFRPYKIAFAVREGSPLRKQINEALLAIYEDGTYEGLSGKWFAQAR
jgi:polar amino acid transport system substrate-binding protein